MNHDLAKMRESLAESARNDLEELRDFDDGEAEAEANALVDRVKYALRILERLPPTTEP